VYSFAATMRKQKKVAASLVAEIDADPVDTGPLSSARYTEPAGFLVVQLYLYISVQTKF